MTERTIAIDSQYAVLIQCVRCVSVYMDVQCVFVQRDVRLFARLFAYTPLGSIEKLMSVFLSENLN